MGIEIEVNTLEEMCDLMCNNKLPKQKENVENEQKIHRKKPDRRGDVID